MDRPKDHLFLEKLSEVRLYNFYFELFPPGVHSLVPDGVNAPYRQKGDEGVSCPTPRHHLLHPLHLLVCVSVTEGGWLMQWAPSSEGREVVGRYQDQGPQMGR